MGYESLSTVVVLVIVVIIMAGWLPARTVKGMKKVAEHREDRYSSSLHLVDQDSGTRFSDEHTPQAKGIIMQPDRMRDAKSFSEHVAHVRQLRHAATRRRRIIAITLLAITILVLGISFPLKFSPLFALIPAVLLVVVLALGVHAASQARAWERKVAAVANGRRARTAKAKAASKSETQAGRAESESKRLAQQPAQPAESAKSVDAADAPGHAVEGPATDVMEQREIRRVLRQAREEQARALAEREAQQPARMVAESDEAGTGQSGDADATRNTSDNAVSGDAAAVVAVVESAEPADETNELSHISPSPAMEAFDVASAQDLISFSLGAPRNGVHIAPDAPESLEIKSMRQVAKAVPVAAEPESTHRNDDPAQVPDADSSHAASDVVSDTNAFHDAEVRRDVEAPEATEESLGTGLEAILARRSS